MSSPFLEVFKPSRVVLVGDDGERSHASDEGPVHLICTPLIKGTGTIDTILKFGRCENPLAFPDAAGVWLLIQGPGPAGTRLVFSSLDPLPLSCLLVFFHKRPAILITQ